MTARTEHRPSTDELARIGANWGEAVAELGRRDPEGANYLVRAMWSHICSAWPECVTPLSATVEDKR